MGNAEIECPACQSDAYYKYGKTANGQVRYRCLVCGRQFTENSTRIPVENRPSCPKCGKSMHVYARESECVRFRCSDYPNCRTYLKIAAEITP